MMGRAWQSHSAWAGSASCGAARSTPLMSRRGRPCQWAPVCLCCCLCFPQWQRRSSHMGQRLSKWVPPAEESLWTRNQWQRHISLSLKCSSRSQSFRRQRLLSQPAHLAGSSRDRRSDLEERRLLECLCSLIADGASTTHNYIYKIKIFSLLLPLPLNALGNVRNLYYSGWITVPLILDTPFSLDSLGQSWCPLKSWTSTWFGLV